MSEGGKAFIALPSTAKEFSRIVPVFKQGAAVTTSRNDVDYIVTDCGIATLAGKTIRQRIKAIIEVAHPKFREELARKAREIFNLNLRH
jgi:4-hydroxybutyrate CoA-transferase